MDRQLVIQLAAGGRHLSISPSDPAFVQFPYAAYTRMRALGPSFFWEDYGFWCFPGFVEVEMALRDRRFGREPPSHPHIPPHLAPFYAFEANSMLELEPPRHTRLRRLVNRAFVSRQVERLRPRIESLAHSLIDKSGRPMEVISDYATPLAVTVIAELLGTPVERASEMLEWSHRMVAMYEHTRSRETEDRAVQATVEFTSFMREHVERRRRQPCDDLISALIAVEQQGDHLTTDELITTCILLMNAGHEATVHAIANSIKAIIEEDIDPRPHLSRPGGARLAVDELLRFDAPLHMFTRFAREDFEFAGMSLARGDKVGLVFGSANRDPRVFNMPDRLDLERDEGGHHSLGAGIHFCVGAPLARLEMEVAIGVLFERFHRPRLTHEPRYADRYHFHGLEQLWIENS